LQCAAHRSIRVRVDLLRRCRACLAADLGETYISRIVVIQVIPCPTTHSLYSITR
jgi:hypothetical protein